MSWLPTQLSVSLCIMSGIAQLESKFYLPSLLWYFSTEWRFTFHSLMLFKLQISGTCSFFQKFSKKNTQHNLRKNNEIPHQPRIKETELAKKMIPMDNFNKRLMNLNLYKNFRLSDPFGIIPHPTCQESGHENPCPSSARRVKCSQSEAKTSKERSANKASPAGSVSSLCHAKCANAQMHGCEVF